MAAKVQPRLNGSASLKKHLKWNSSFPRMFRANQMYVGPHLWAPKRKTNRFGPRQGVPCMIPVTAKTPLRESFQWQGYVELEKLAPHPHTPLFMQGPCPTWKALQL